MISTRTRREAQRCTHPHGQARSGRRRLLWLPHHRPGGEPLAQRGDHLRDEGFQAAAPCAAACPVSVSGPTRTLRQSRPRPPFLPPPTRGGGARQRSSTPTQHDGVAQEEEVRGTGAPGRGVDGGGGRLLRRAGKQRDPVVACGHLQSPPACQPAERHRGCAKAGQWGAECAPAPSPAAGPPGCRMRTSRPARPRRRRRRRRRRILLRLPGPHRRGRQSSRSAPHQSWRRRHAVGPHRSLPPPRARPRCGRWPEGSGWRPRRFWRRLLRPSPPPPRAAAPSRPCRRLRPRERTLWAGVQRRHRPR
jgi:hypothetical protein